MQAGGDEVFKQLVLARVIEPTSKLDSLRVLGGGDGRAVACDPQASATGVCRVVGRDGLVSAADVGVPRRRAQLDTAPAVESGAAPVGVTRPVARFGPGWRGRVRRTWGWTRRRTCCMT